MKAQIINPRSNVKVSIHDCVIFLAGPVQGADDWQTQLAELLASELDDAYIATPRSPKIDENFDYTEQVSWEKRHLELAARNGVIVFWFAAQNLSLEYETGRAYAQTTRLEIGRVFGWLDYNPKIKVVVGFDEDYTKNGGGSERYIRSLCAEHGLLVASSLLEISKAVPERLATKR